MAKMQALQAVSSATDQGLGKSPSSLRPSFPTWRQGSNRSASQDSEDCKRH